MFEVAGGTEGTGDGVAQRSADKGSVRMDAPPSVIPDQRLSLWRPFTRSSSFSPSSLIGSGTQFSAIATNNGELLQNTLAYVLYISWVSSSCRPY